MRLAAAVKHKDAIIIKKWAGACFVVGKAGEITYIVNSHQSSGNEDSFVVSKTCTGNTLVMDIQTPIKTVSRAAARKRTGRARMLWFVAGTSFGVGFASLATGLLGSTSLAPGQFAAADVEIHSSFIDVLPAEAAATPVRLFAEIPGQAGPVTESPAAAAEIKIADKDTYPLALDLEVENGDTLIDMLTDTGVSYQEAQAVVNSIRRVYDPRKLGIGEKVAVELDKHPASPDKPIIASMILPVSLTSTLKVTRVGDDNFSVRKVEAATEKHLARAGGKITSSLYETGVKAGISPTLLGELITAFSYDVDFQRDIQPGDAIDVLYEKIQTEDGIAVGQGNMIYAQLTTGGRPLRVYRYIDGNGNVDYYNERGESMRKALLRTPINGAKITSGFGMRNHPILGYSKMHRGVDFAAPTGTPVYAAGDGTVEVVGRKGGYGNYVRIRHSGKYSSAYAHLSRFASTMAAGKKVKQGQIIGYVGSTGQSTGPHLHYEILANNQQVNPSNVKFKGGNALGGKELAAFKKKVAKIESTLASIPTGKTLAMADAQKLGLPN